MLPYLSNLTALAIVSLEGTVGLTIRGSTRALGKCPLFPAWPTKSVRHNAPASDAAGGFPTSILDVRPSSCWRSSEEIDVDRRR